MTTAERDNLQFQLKYLEIDNIHHAIDTLRQLILQIVNTIEVSDA